jgi:hypothetical protein
MFSEMGEAEIQDFLTYLAVNKQAAAASQNPKYRTKSLKTRLE